MYTRGGSVEQAVFHTSFSAIEGHNLNASFLFTFAGLVKEAVFLSRKTTLPGGAMPGTFIKEATA